jgi:hypothetical protein
VTRNYYIYYRSAASATRVRDTVSAMQAALAHEFGVTGRLLRRADDPGTWMEVYEDVADPEGFERALTSAVDRFGALSLLAAGTERHVERFITDWEECA